MPVKPLFFLSSLSFSYGENKILDKVSLEIMSKDFIAVIGPNGSGKTTLMKILLGTLKPTKGKITCNIPKTRIGYVPQRYTIAKDFPGTVEEILENNAEKVLKELGVASLAKKKFVDLSGGQQQRVLIAKALQQDPLLLILDEPTAGVDVNAQRQFYTHLKKLNKKGIAILLVTHEVGVVPSLVKKIFCINHRLCCVGNAKDMPVMLKQMYGPQFVQHHHHGGK